MVMIWLLSGLSGAALIRYLPGWPMGGDTDVGTDTGCICWDRSPGALCALRPNSEQLAVLKQLFDPETVQPTNYGTHAPLNPASQSVSLSVHQSISPAAAAAAAGAIAGAQVTQSRRTGFFYFKCCHGPPYRSPSQSEARDLR